MFKYWKIAHAKKYNKKTSCNYKMDFFKNKQMEIEFNKVSVMIYKYNGKLHCKLKLQ